MRAVIVLEGINDIGYSSDADIGCEAPNTDVSAAQIINGYKTLIAAAHSHGVKIFGCTLTPFGSSWFWSVEGQAKWQAVNDWIRTSGAFDGVFDFARAVADPQDPNDLNPADDAGDGLHPNDAGLRGDGQLDQPEPPHPVGPAAAGRAARWRRRGGRCRDRVGVTALLLPADHAHDRAGPRPRGDVHQVAVAGIGHQPVGPEHLLDGAPVVRLQHDEAHVEVGVGGVRHCGATISRAGVHTPNGSCPSR